MTSDIGFMTAAELATAYRDGALSPVEATKALLGRIARLNPTLNAYNLIDEESALRDAREAEQRWHHGKQLSPLDGVPASIKDIILTKGWPTLRGSKTVQRDQPWTEDAPVTARLREAGCVLLGKTATPEFGWKGVTDNPLSGITRNPWDTRKTPGGSSGGASAQLAAGLAPLAIGTDGGGSIRIPAGFAGVTGLKPSFGRVPAYPISPFGTVAHIGPMARSVEDCLLMLREIAKPDARDWFALPWRDEDFSDRMDGDISRLKIAYSPRLGYAAVDDEVARLVVEAVAVLAELGAAIEEVDPPFEDPVEIFHTHWFVGAFNALSALPEEAFAQIDPGLRETYERGRAIDMKTYLAAVATRNKLGAAMRGFHEKFDLLVTPSLPMTAFEAGRLAPINMG